MSEVSTIQLEFLYLSKLTGKRVYGEKADAVLDHVGVFFVELRVNDGASLDRSRDENTLQRWSLAYIY